MIENLALVRGGSVHRLRSWHIAGLDIVELLGDAGTQIAPHEHARAYFSLNLAGGFTERRGAESSERGPGSAVFRAFEDNHALTVGRVNAHCLNVELSALWLERLREVGAVPDDVVRDEGGPLVWLGTRLYEELFSSAPGWPLIVEGLFLEILGNLAKAQGPAGDRHQPRWLAKVEQIIREEFLHELTVMELARRVGVHPVHLSRTWRRFRGHSIGHSVQRARIERACEQITRGRRTLAEIALDVGFADQTHFSRVFKRITGSTPGNFRSLYAQKADGGGRAQ